MRTSKVVKVGNLLIGGGNEIIILYMTNTPTIDVKKTVEQIKKLQEEGCQLVRVTVNNEEAAKSIRFIKEQISIPLVADIHFDYKLALLAIENGIDKLRINPGNIGSDEKVVIVVKKAMEREIQIRS